MMAAEKIRVVSHMADVLWQAARALANVCDGARSEDGCGFNKFDARRGHNLANEDPATWDLEKCRSAKEMLNKYRRQLAEHGIDLSTLRIFPAGEIGLDADGETFLFRFPYMPEAVMDLKRSWGERSWSPKARVWRVKVDEINASRIFDFASKWGIPIEPHAELRARRLEDALAQIRTRKKEDPRQQKLPLDKPELKEPQGSDIGWRAKEAQDLFR